MKSIMNTAIKTHAIFGLLSIVVMTACLSQPRPLVACDQIRTKSYETGVITTSLFLSPQPTIGEVLKCFGDPDAYYIADNPAPDSSGIAFAMFYPAKGLVFYHNSYSTGITTFHKDSLLTGVTIILPGTITSTIYGVYNTPDEVITKTVPWPSKFDVIRLPAN
jgi:hypothetical protein